MRANYTGRFFVPGQLYYNWYFQQEKTMKTQNFINIQEAARILRISTKALHQRINAGYYDVKKVGTVLVDPATGQPLTAQKLKTILIRHAGRQPGKYGNYKSKHKQQSGRATTMNTFNRSLRLL